MDDHDPLAEYWDLVQHAYDYAAETERIVELFAENTVRSVLDLGCGTGSHLIELAKRGYEGVGVDRSANMVQAAGKKAKKLGLSLRFCQADMFHLPFSRRFDAALSVYMMSSFLNAARFRKALCATRHSLRPGGMLVFNALNEEFDGPAVENSNGEQPLCFMDLGFRQHNVSLVRFNRMISKGKTQDWTYVYLIQDKEHLSVEILHNPMRTFTLTWIRRQLAASGFRFQSVRYVDIGEHRNWDMLISAIAE